MTNRVILRKVEKYFDSLQYNLTLYYHKQLRINEIYNKVLKKHPHLKELFNEPFTTDPAALIMPVDEERRTYLLVNSTTTIGQIQHESNHIAMHSFLITGSSHTEETDELYAYHSQLIFEFILQTMLYKLNVPIKDILLF